MVGNMRNKKTAALAALAVTGAAVALVICGTFAVRTVFAAEQQVMMADETSGTVLQAMTDVEVMEVYKNTFYGDNGCTMVLPTGYVSSENVKGMYVAERHPMDSSNIYYTVSENMDTAILDKAINTEDYKEQMEARFKESCGADAAITSYRAVKTDISGCPAYEIELSCQVGEMEMEQLIYVIMADQVYTITYSQSADDERMEDFKKSAETISVVFNNKAG